YGLSVFGTVHPKHIVRNKGALPGDLLFLTKPLGMGIKSAAFKIGSETEESMRPVIDAMMELNAAAAEAMLQADVHAATDVTGFGFAGHLHEMLEASACSAVISWEALPLFEGVVELSRAYCRPSRTFSVMDFAEEFVEQGTLPDEEFDTRMGVICDPQTSGGLLIALPPEMQQVFVDAFERLTGRLPALIGVVCEGNAGVISFAN
ncbi:MAG: selenide, water dikinase SelD, partial [Raoultibacter sp.]